MTNDEAEKIKREEAAKKKAEEEKAAEDEEEKCKDPMPNAGNGGNTDTYHWD